jgi:ABC-type multidrug transport system ATPase subunit
VMNQGRKVFEGPLSAINGTQRWIFLRVNDFPAAAQLLKQAKLIEDERDGNSIALAPQAGTDAVVRCLVQNGFSVHEITSREPTLEDFYLSLMKSSKAQTNARPSQSSAMANAA